MAERSLVTKNASFRIQLLAARKGSSRARTNRQIKSSMNNNNSLSLLFPIACFMLLYCCSATELNDLRTFKSLGAPAAAAAAEGKQSASAAGLLC